jgi:hypothetical protein
VSVSKLSEDLSNIYIEVCAGETVFLDMGNGFYWEFGNYFDTLNDCRKAISLMTGQAIDLRSSDERRREKKMERELARMRRVRFT